MIRMKLSKIATVGVISEVDVKEEAAELNKSIENELKKLMPEETEKELSNVYIQYGKRALVIQQKIEYLQRVIHSLITKGQGNEEKQVLLQKQYSLLSAALKEGYKFVLELRTFVTKEKMGYAVRIADGRETSLGIYSIDEFLPMATLVESAEGKFGLALKNVEQINKTANQQNDLSKRFQKELNAINSNYGAIFKQVMAHRLARRRNGEDIPVYTMGMGGFILERAFSAFAQGEDYSTILDFARDTDRYSSGGDLQGSEVMKVIKKTFDNLEVKNITVSGAGLVSLDTLMRDLKKIIEICLNSKLKTKKAVKQKLEAEIFKNKGHVKAIEKKLAEELNNISDKIFNSLST